VRPISVVLNCIRGGSSLALGGAGSVVIGRENGNCMFESKKVSRKHFRVELRVDGSVCLTRLSDKPIWLTRSAASQQLESNVTHVLHHEDRLRFGDHDVEYRIEILHEGEAAQRAAKSASFDNSIMRRRRVATPAAKAESAIIDLTGDDDDGDDVASAGQTRCCVCVSAL
jgi:predicted component of type VI protein secretion system